MAGKPTDQELALWRRVTAEAKPMDRQGLMDAAAPEPADKDAAPSPTPNRSGLRKRPPSARSPHAGHGSAPPGENADSAPRSQAGRAPGIDRRTALRLKRGQMAIEGRIDLHGMQQEEATALDGFIATSRAAGRRCVLVITGKGARDGDDHRPFRAPSAPGILRRQVPAGCRTAPTRRPCSPSPPPSPNMAAAARLRPAPAAAGRTR